jgi:hypothetical protein
LGMDYQKLWWPEERGYPEVEGWPEAAPGPIGRYGTVTPYFYGLRPLAKPNRGVSYGLRPASGGSTERGGR